MTRRRPGLAGILVDIVQKPSQGSHVVADAGKGPGNCDYA
jgi:hypothetical protein